MLRFQDYDDYAYRGMKAIGDRLEHLLAPLPVERVVLDPEPASTEGHVLGTVVMGNDPATSVVDRFMVHHRIRNLAVLGGSAFPTGSPSNPTLTISALALWSAAHLMSTAVGPDPTEVGPYCRTLIRVTARMSALDAPTPISYSAGSTSKARFVSS